MSKLALNVTDSCCCNFFFLICTHDFAIFRFRSDWLYKSMKQNNSRRHLNYIALKNSDRNMNFLIPNTISFEKATVFSDFILIYKFHWCTTSWELWKHIDPVPGGRPIFFKPDWPKESKNGFKIISCCPPLLMIFSKNCFSAKKIVKKIGRSVDFWIFMAIYMDKLDQF